MASTDTQREYSEASFQTAGASYEDVKSAINQYLIEQTEVMGTYAKQ